MTRFRRPVTYLAVVLAVFLAWQALTTSGVVKPLLLSSPADVWAALKALWSSPSTVLEPVAVTLRETTIAFVSAAVVAIPLGLLIGSSVLLRKAYEPMLTSINAVPLVVLYPVLAAIMGVGSSSKIVLGALYAFFPMVIATTRAAAQVDPRLLRAAQVMGASKAQSLRSVTVPAITEPVIAGMRVALALALVTIIAAEFIAGADGVGYQLGFTSQGLDTPTLFAWVLIACALTVVVNVAFTLTTNAVWKGIHR